jgi:hypothetical protein
MSRSTRLLTILNLAVLAFTLWMNLAVIPSINPPTEAASKIGPMLGLRTPVYDYVKMGYWYFKPNADQFQIDPDPAGTSDGIWSIKFPPPTPPPAPDPTLLHRVWLVTGLPPVLGASCADVGENSVWIGAQGLYVCIPDTTGLTFVWAGAPLQTAPPIVTGTALPPTVGAPCGINGKWFSQAGLYVCSEKTVFPWMWALIPNAGVK